MKKGFTLIELLAVILILGIISLIAIPVVTNIIEDAKKNALKNTASNILSITEDYVTIQDIKGYSIGTKKFSFPDNVDLDIKSQPQNGFVRVIDGNSYEIAIDDGTYCAYKNYDSDNIEVIKLNSEKCNSKLTYKERSKSYLKKYFDATAENDRYLYTEFKDDAYLHKIVKVDLLYDEVKPNNAIISWDLSEAKDNSIIGWITPNSTNSSYYDLTISSSNDIYANPDSTNWFGDLVHLQSINFDNFNTSDVIYIGEMFYDNEYLLSLDLSDFNTSNVKDMWGMFSSCKSLQN